MQIILVALGGAIGSVLRYLMIHTIYLTMPRTFPYGTLVVNYLGCFLIGLLFMLIFKYFGALSESLRALLLVGFLGGFTTFSAFSLDTFNLLQTGKIGLACSYIMTSVLGCLLLTWFGIYLGNKL